MGKRIKVRDLSCEHVDVKPQDVDWSDLRSGEEGWIAWEAQRCETCDETMAGEVPGFDTEHRNCDPSGKSTCMGHVPLTEGPMMNFFYPCAWKGEEESALAIAHLPLCLIIMPDGDHGLALTGGGMDLSWEICEAYMCLGFLPPRHFAGSLPSMSHHPSQLARKRNVLAAARRSVSVMRGWLDSDVRTLKHVGATMVAKKAK